MLTNHYWYIPNAFTQNECDYLEEKGEEAFEAHSKDGFHFGEDATKRSSQISWIYDQDALSMLENVAYSANVDAGWVLDLVRPEAVQYTTYEEGGEYDWHTDGHQDRYAAKHLVGTATDPMPLNQTTNPLLAGLVRKLSVTVNLNSPEDYEGGTLELLFHNQHHTFIERAPRGSAIIFPSFIHHRITPVTEGIRKSAVMWVNGPPIR